MKDTGIARSAVALSLAVSSFVALPARASVTAASTAPAHHVDGGFRNLGGVPGHGQAPPTVTLPFFLRRVLASFSRDSRRFPPKIANNGAFLRENALGSVPTVTWVGHSTLLVQMGHVTFLTDPIWSSTASPVAVGPRMTISCVPKPPKR